MKEIEVYDTEYDRIQEICEKFDIEECDVIDMVFQAIEYEEIDLEEYY